MANLRLANTKSTIPGNLPYRVLLAVASASDMDPEVFVLDSYDQLQRIASVDDMLDIGVVPGLGIPYRSDTCSQDFATKKLASTFLKDAEDKVNYLVAQINEGYDVYSGGTAVTYIDGRLD